MEGKIDPILVKKLGHASFDERLSVVSLILARTTEGFRNAYRKEACMTMLLEVLQEVKEGFMDGADADFLLSDIIKRVQDTLAMKKKAKNTFKSN